MHYDGKTFRGRTNTPNGEVTGETLFRYRQEGDRLSGEYAGGSIVHGHLLGTVHPDGTLEFYYHHQNTEGALMAGYCRSTPVEIEGRLVLRERWQWLTGDRSAGESEVVEV
jgi:hypothetical protein